MSTIILLIVTWAANMPPDVQAFSVRDMPTCQAMARSFAKAEDDTNDYGYWAKREHYTVSCERKIGGDKVEA